jgi:dTDP-glucose 4,6-dehydratase
MAELYVANSRSEDFSGYTSCRFGNVFNSRGSAIETFIYQIINRQPLTLTNSKIKRFFMSVEEAAYLTLKSTLINSGDVHIFDMGEPILLELIIENLQKVLGMRSSVVITGLRDGEKMNEDLFGINEDSFETIEARIKCANLELELKDNQDLIREIASRDESSILKKLSSMTALKTF